MNDVNSIMDDDDDPCKCSDSIYTFGFNDKRFSNRELTVQILADDEPTNQSQLSQSAENGYEASNGDNSSCLEVKKFHVNSILLAAKSPFFLKLFTIGMMESVQSCCTMRIQASEEAALMELLNYMYNGTLTDKSAPALLNLLKLADKFQVDSCTTLCARLLMKLPMRTRSALLYLTSNLPMVGQVHLLADKAKQFLQTRYKDIDRVRDKIMTMPLPAIEAILSSDILQVPSEDAVYDLALDWAKAHYPKAEDQRRVLSAHLGRYIRFPYMSVEKLREVLTSDALDGDFARRLALDALSFATKKAGLHHQRTAAEEEEEEEGYYWRPFVRRDYKRRPVRVVGFESPCRELAVYFELTFHEYASLKPSECVSSEAFDLGGRALYLKAQCSAGGPLGSLNFSVALGFEVQVPHHSAMVLEYEFAVRSRIDRRFNVIRRSGAMHHFTGGHDIVLFEAPWNDFRAGQSALQFVDGVLYIEVRLRIGRSI